MTMSTQRDGTAAGGFAASGQGGSFGRSLGRPWAILVRAWGLRRDRILLEGMSDDMLKDIGIRRSEIERAVRYGRV